MAASVIQMAALLTKQIRLAKRKSSQFASHEVCDIC